MAQSSASRKKEKKTEPPIINKRGSMRNMTKKSEEEFLAENLIIPLHYEDAGSDEDLKEKVPRLRMVQMQKDAERKRNEEEELAARLKRELIERQNNLVGNKKGEKLNIADMDIAFGTDG
eukprot:CAMPEP_0170497362 /NCGR_PEP_ID=MMETSP0208-20121228/24578_1 /TAXON_ID=197538 /ORGANISM="Strombidium inclinatum, Strain S3" /LENGTH=119 /DNA_ID=CAMNT_0010774159 /DNA_START=640 /DNA_END=999 /DNA_ORIENTATION=-